MEHNNDTEFSEVIQTKDVVVTTKTKRDLFLPISILAAAVMIGGAILFASLYKGGAATNTAGGTGTDNTGGAATTTVNPAVMNLGPRDAILGNTNAKVTLIEYGDYQCPFCAQFFSQTEPQIIQNYVNTGKVRFVFRNFAFLGAESTAAAEAAECAEDQNKLWAYHDALYGAKVADEQKGGGEDDGFYNAAEFIKLAQQVGLNMSTFTTCVNTNQDASIVAQDKTSAGTYSVNSTPSFFINGTAISGAQPYSVFQAALDAALQG
jgi:protein-disulfide isomerase